MSVFSIVIPMFLLSVGAVMFVIPGGFDVFTKGAMRGMKTTASVLPSMLALTVAVSMFTSSGGAELLARAAAPVCRRIGVPPDTLPLIVTRPISGSAASAAFAELIKTVGADSTAGLVAAVIMGSSDTLVYVMAVYFGRTRVRRAARAFVIAGVTSVFCVFMSCFLVRLFFPA